MAFTLTVEMTFLLAVAIFWIVLYVIARVFHLDKHGLEVQPGYFMYKSTAFNSYIDRLAKKRRFLWLVLSNIGLAFSIGLMTMSFYILGINLVRFVVPASGQAGPVFPAIPVLFIRLYWLPYFFFAAAVIMVTHELAHGITARLEGIPVLSTGILAFILLFGAFVEPDEKEFEKVSILGRLRMLAAGSSTNLVTALLVILLMTGLFVPTSSGVLVQEVSGGSPASNAGIGQWDVIRAINGTPVLFPQNYSSFTSRIKPGDYIALTVLHGNEEVTKILQTEADPSNSSRAIIGVFLGDIYRQNRLGLDQYSGVNLYLTMFWTYLLGISVSIFNMLPAYPFDGERFLYYPLASLVKKRKRELRWALNAIAWGLFALNVIFTFFIFGLASI
jgi:membrane-associated protease RseP (regulator of RpoE activity)